MNGNWNINQAQLEQIERMKREMLSNILTKEARERLGRVRVVKPNLVAQVELYLLKIYQTGQVKEKIDDEKLKQILKAVGSKKEWSIKRR